MIQIRRKFHSCWAESENCCTSEKWEYKSTIKTPKRRDLMQPPRHYLLSRLLDCIERPTVTHRKSQENIFFWIFWNKNALEHFLKTASDDMTDTFDQTIFFFQIDDNRRWKCEQVKVMHFFLDRRQIHQVWRQNYEKRKLICSIASQNSLHVNVLPRKWRCGVQRTSNAICRWHDQLLCNRWNNRL